MAELYGRGGRARPALKFRRPTTGGGPSPSSPRPAPRARWLRPPSGDSPTCCFLPRHSSPLEKPLCRTTAGAPLQRCHPLRPLPVPPFPASPPKTHSNSKNGAAEEKTAQLNQVSRILNHSSMLASFAAASWSSSAWFLNPSGFPFPLPPFPASSIAGEAARSRFQIDDAQPAHQSLDEMPPRQGVAWTTFSGVVVE